MDDSEHAVGIFHRGRCANKFVTLLITSFALTSVCSVFAQTSSPLNDDALRKIAKQSHRLARAESLDQAEKLLRNTIAANPGSAEIKTELAYVLAKRHALREA